MEREPGTESDATEQGADAARPRPRIDVSPALHEAGHEVHDLGYEDVPDDGPVLHPEHEPANPADPLDFVNVRMPSD